MNMRKSKPGPAALAALPDDELLEAVQRQTFRFFWEGAHPLCGLAPDRLKTKAGATDDLVAIGGSGFGIMTIIIAAERGWVSRAAAVERLGAMLELLVRATCYHGVFPHFMNGRTGAALPFSRKDDGGDLVETSFLIMGLLCARAYFNRGAPEEAVLRDRIYVLWHDVEWDWYARDGREVLYWHWSPNNDWALDLEIRGWNEALVTYVLAASAPRYAVNPVTYQRGFAAGRDFVNGKSYYDIRLPLGPPFGGPLSFAHYSFTGIDPRELKDRYADFWDQCVRHVRINRTHCERNPLHHKGYSASCWGLSSSDDFNGYAVHTPDCDNGTISPTAAVSSMPYAPREALQAMRHFLTAHGDKVWGRFGFVDAFCEAKDWFADSYVAIDQGPIIIMIENYRTGLLWKLFMSVPEVQAGLRKLSFSSPHFTA
jgi:hypothetical protein